MEIDGDDINKFILSMTDFERMREAGAFIFLAKVANYHKIGQSGLRCWSTRQ